MGKGGRPYSYCRACATKRTREYRSSLPVEKQEQYRIEQSRRMAKIREDFVSRLNSLKSERPCYDCGGNFNFQAMEFDHIGKKSFELTKGYKYPWDKVRKEIDKCQLVCANCHRIRTDSRRTKA